MGLYAEIEELKNSFSKNSFREGSILTRIFMVLGFFLTLSSLTELSGIIVKWKGFILDGLKFYHSVFVEPVSLITSHIGLRYTELEIHVATVSSICIAIGMRVLIMGQKVAFRKISEKYGNEVKPNLILFWVIGIFVPLGLWAWYGLKDPKIYIWWVTFTSLFLPIFIVFPKVIMSKFSEHVFYERGSFNYFKSYYIYIASLLLIIAILAAVNSGLNQSKETPNAEIQLMSGRVAAFLG